MAVTTNANGRPTNVTKIPMTILVLLRFISAFESLRLASQAITFFRQ